MDTSRLLDHLTADIATVGDVARTGDPAAPVAGCPGWTLTDLVVHLGSIHRWARHAVLYAERPTPEAAAADPAPEGRDALADWFLAGGDRLLAALRSVPPDAPTWHPFPVPRVAGLWPRRQAQEASVHRWDAEHAVGRAATIDADVATDGIDEYFTVMLRRLVTREGLAVPATALGVRCTDTGARWVVRGVDGDVAPTADDPDALVEGEAAWVLQRLWGRPVPEGSVVVSGDSAAAAAWLALGGV